MTIIGHETIMEVNPVAIQGPGRLRGGVGGFKPAARFYELYLLTGILFNFVDVRCSRHRRRRDDPGPIRA